MAKLKAYFKVKDTKEEIKVSFGYDMGTFNGRSRSTRGYYAYVQPVERSDRFESTTVFEGFKQLLKEVPRQSKKAELEAIEMFRLELTTFAEDMANRKGWTLTGDAPEIKEG